ncbi:hypothetical protein [Nonomuraea sp. NPDC002799]
MRWTATMAGVVGLAALPAPAQATAAVDVVAAVQRLQAQGHSVKVVQHTAGGDRRAADLAKVGSAAHKLRGVGGVLYGAGPAYGGKSWVRLGGRLDAKYSRITLHWRISTDLSGRPVIVQAI